MGFIDLGLWEQEEELIHECLSDALSALIESGRVAKNSIEDKISGELRPFLTRAKKRRKLNPMIIPQMAIYDEFTDAKPNGFPDIGFCWNDTDYNQIEYHVECKRLSYLNKTFCPNYIKLGVRRYNDRIYARDYRSGTMIAYVQDGSYEKLLDDVNAAALRYSIEQLNLCEKWNIKGVSKLKHKLYRPDEFLLTHLWADFR